MSLDWQCDIIDFMTVGEQACPATPALPDGETVALRKRLILEEAQECVEAMREKDIPHLAKELSDLIVVTIGTAVAYGIDLRPIWDAVHESNMAKFPDGKAIKDEGGKILKPEGWTKPDMTVLIEAQKAE